MNVYPARNLRMFIFVAGVLAIFLCQVPSANGTEAFIWDPVNGMQGLGVLPGGEFNNSAKDINDAGQVVGYGLNANGHHEAFIWDPVNGMLGLGFLVGKNFESWAQGINNAGQVVGSSTVPDPVPEPTSLLLLGTGLVGLMGLRRK